MKAIAVLVTIVALAGLSAAPVWALERPFDAELSLIGKCSLKVEKLDPIEDPGCPENPPAGPHPPAGFSVPSSVTTDAYGNIYVGVYGVAADGSQGRIDIFDPKGRYIEGSEIKTPLGPKALAVDSTGVLYVMALKDNEPPEADTTELLRYTPTPSEYEPDIGKIKYETPPETAPVPATEANNRAIAIDQDDDHLFVNFGGRVVEYSSAAEGNAEVREFDLDVIFGAGYGVAVDASRDRLYASRGANEVLIFDLNSPGSTPIGAIKGSAVPAGEFINYISVAVDESTGNVFVYDVSGTKVYEFSEDGTYLETIEHNFELPIAVAQLGVDNGQFSPNGGENPFGRYLYVPSHRVGIGHVFAFEPKPVIKAPEITALQILGVTETEVELGATINPSGAATDFLIEYTTQASFEAEGFANAAVALSGALPAVNKEFDRSAAIDGLQPETQYRFRVVATNEIDSKEKEGTFKTFPALIVDADSCTNRALRTGLSALLPDCRAYELVTPADTNAKAPVGTGHVGYFTTKQVSPEGDRVPWRVEGGTLGGTEGTGSFLGDPYLSSRTPDGWTTIATGPSGSETPSVTAGGSSPDQTYSFWTSGGGGPAAIEGKMTSYVRYPDGHKELVGQGSLGQDVQASGRLISEDGGHIIFTTGSVAPPVQLEPDAAPSGTRAIYDRTSDGVTHVISLFPGDVPAGEGQNSEYVGASLDGKGVAFRFGTTLYLRYENEETYEIGTNVKVAGVAEGGNRVFYVEGGQLKRFDALTEDVTPFNETGTAIPVTVSADGSAAYFISTSVLSGEPNPNEAFPQAGQQNLYLSKEGDISFVGTVTERDAKGTPGPTETIDGLGLWVAAVEPPTPGRLGLVPARTTPDGDTLLFQSRAVLDGYNPEGHAEIYRYDLSSGSLQCLTCSPTLTPATGDDSLYSESREGSFALFYPLAWLANLRPDGRRAFFQSSEALVASDTDDRQDVYEWEDQGVGSCTSPGGCIYLISSGNSLRNDYLWGVSDSGNDVFFLTSDLLLPADKDETASIYDARVDGGFPEPPPPAICQGEGCRPGMTPPPPLPAVLTPALGPSENAPRTCPKGKRKVKKKGKVRCVKPHKKKQKNSKAASNRKGGRK